MTFANCPLTSIHIPIPFPTTNKQILPFFFFREPAAVRVGTVWPCDPDLKPTRASKIQNQFRHILKDPMELPVMVVHVCGPSFLES